MASWNFAQLHTAIEQDENTHTVTLPIGGATVCLSALAVMSNRRVWDAMDDADWDELDALICNVSTALITDVGSGGSMIGQIFMWCSINPPPGCLFCDGSEYAGVDYPGLYALLYAWFPGSDVDHFCVPDMQNAFVWGAETATPGWRAGDTGGETDHTLTEDEIPAHTHTDSGHTHTDSGHTHTDSGHSHTTTASSTNTVGGTSALSVIRPGTSGTRTGTDYANVGTGTASIGNGVADIQEAGAGEAHNNMPPWINMAFCIVAE
jgi:microcystin-dependent protein